MSSVAKSTASTLISSYSSRNSREGRNRVATAINTALVQTYWTIGQHIVEYEQQGNERAEYGSKLLDRLSHDLSERYGKGFSRSNVVYIRKFYLSFPKGETVSHLLSWSHYVEILKGDAPLETGFYVILIKSCLCILFPKCAINAAFRKQNNIPYFLGQLIYVVLYQHIIFRTFRVRKSMCLYMSVV